MPKSFLVKKARRLDEQTEESVANSGANNEGFFASRDAMLNDKCENTLRRLYNLSGENTLLAHGKTRLNDARNEPMFDADRKSAVRAKQITGNGEVIPRHLWFFPPLLLQDGNPYAKFCQPTYKLNEPTSKEGGCVLPVSRDESRKESVSRNPDQMSEDGEMRKRGIDVLQTQVVTGNNEHVFSTHRNATSTTFVPPKRFYPSILPRLKSADAGEIFPFSLQPTGNVFESMKRKRMEGERPAISAAKDDAGVFENSYIPESKKRRSERESGSPKRFRGPVGCGDNDEYRLTAAKDDVLVLDNSHIPEAKTTSSGRGSVGLRNPSEQWKNERYNYHWEANLRQSEDNKMSSEKRVSGEVDKHGWKQNDRSAAKNEAITVRVRECGDLKNHYFHYFSHPDWCVSMPYFNSVRSVNDVRKAESSSVWIPYHLVPTGQVNGAAKGVYKTDIWKPELMRADGLLRDHREKEIFNSNDEDVTLLRDARKIENFETNDEDGKKMETKLTSKNRKGLLPDDPLSPKLSKERVTQENSVDCHQLTVPADHKDHIADVSWESRDLKANSADESPDPSVIDTDRRSSDIKKEMKVKKFQGVRVPTNFSLTDGFVWSLSSPEYRTNLTRTDERQREDDESRRSCPPDPSMNKTDGPSVDIKKAEFRDVCVPTNYSPTDNFVCSLRSPERRKTSEARTDDRQRELLESLRLLKDAKTQAVSEKPKEKVFSDHSTVWLINKETKTSKVNFHAKDPSVTSSPPFWTATNGLTVETQLSILASKTQERSTKGKEALNATHNHRCEICNSTFPLRRLLNRHLKTHSFYKRYTCSYCEKGFNDTFDLKRHVRTHTGIKPFKCDRCDKSFTQRCSLEAHQSRVHGVVHKFGFRERRSKIFVCEHCGTTFRDSQSEFMSHMASAHPDMEKTPWAKKNNRLSQLITF